MFKMAKKVLLSIIIITLLLVNLSTILAITASLGNARMILRLDVGQSVEKYVLVKNVNDVPVIINITVSGDLKDYVTLKDKSFALNSGEEKKAYFTIKAGKNTTTETKIDVKFTPIGEKHGVGLSSTIIVVPTGGNLSDIETSENNNSDSENIDNETETGIDNQNQEKSPGITQSIKNIKISPVGILLLITGTIFLIFIILVIIYYLRKNKKSSIITTQTEQSKIQQNEEIVNEKLDEDTIKPKKKGKK